MSQESKKSAEKTAGTSSDQALREHLLFALGEGGAHLSFDDAITGIPAELRGVKPANLSFSPWRLLEHLRIAQWDIVEFCVNPKHVSPAWPKGYWPEEDTPPDASAWDKSVRQFRHDLERMQDLVANPASDLYAPLPHGDGQTLLREALLVVDHNAYHLGQLVMVRRLLGAWAD